MDMRRVLQPLLHFSTLYDEVRLKRAVMLATVECRGTGSVLEVTAKEERVARHEV